MKSISISPARCLQSDHESNNTPTKHTYYFHSTSWMFENPSRQSALFGLHHPTRLSYIRAVIFYWISRGDTNNIFSSAFLQNGVFGRSHHYRIPNGILSMMGRGRFDPRLSMPPADIYHVRQLEFSASFAIFFCGSIFLFDYFLFTDGCR